MKAAQYLLAALRRKIALDIADHEDQGAKQRDDLDNVIQEKLQAAHPAIRCIQAGR